jgi:hypothetical protein
VDYFTPESENHRGCTATTSKARADGWTYIEPEFLPSGLYCPMHAEAIEEEIRDRLENQVAKMAT